MKTLEELTIAINEYKAVGKSYDDLYYDNIQAVMENEIRNGGYISEEHIADIARKEISRSWESQHSNGIPIVVSDLYSSPLRKR